MKTKEIEALESYFTTENEHWNGFAFDMLCEVLKQGNFENPETPLQLFNISTDIFCQHYKQPLQAVELFNDKMDNEKLSPAQKLFVYEAVISYLKQSEFGYDFGAIKDLLKSRKDKLKAENQPVKPLTGNIRDTLKELLQKELEQLPETLKELEPVQRLNILCKLMPFILPKVESVTHKLDEPSSTI